MSTMSGSPHPFELRCFECQQPDPEMREMVIEYRRAGRVIRRVSWPVCRSCEEQAAETVSQAIGTGD